MTDTSFGRFFDEFDNEIGVPEDHENNLIQSTQIYTHVTVDELSETYQKTHPAAKNPNTE